MLSGRWKQDLHWAICDYIKELGGDHMLMSSLQSFLEPKDNGKSDQADKSDEYKTPRDPLILPRKWNSIVRLQRRIMELEKDIKALDEELASIKDNDNGLELLSPDGLKWLPRSYPSFQFNVGSSINSLSLHPSLPIVFIGTDQGRLLAYDLLDYMMPISSTQGHMKGITSISIYYKNDNGELLIATTSKDLQCKIWRFIDNCKIQLIRSLTSHEHIVSSCKFIEHGTDLLLSTCSRDLSVKIWDTSNGWCLRSFQAHNQWIRTLDIWGDYILTGGNDTTIRLTHWSSSRGLSMGLGHEFPVEKIVIIPMKKECSNTIYESFDLDYEPIGFKYCLSASRDNLIILWKIPLPKFIPHRPPQPDQFNTNFEIIRKFKGHDSWVKDIIVRGNYLFSCSDDKSIKCWGLETGECIKSWDSLSIGFINCLITDNSSSALKRNLLLSGSTDGKCNVFMK